MAEQLCFSSDSANRIQVVVVQYHEVYYCRCNFNLNYLMAALFAISIEFEKIWNYPKMSLYLHYLLSVLSY